MLKRKSIMCSISHARRIWCNMMKQIAREEGIPDSYRQIIMFLSHNPGACQKDIAEFSGVTTSAINQSVKSMLEEQFIYKEADSSDKRNTRLFLTEQGSEIAERLRRRLDHADALITKYMGAEKEAELIRLLDNLSDFIQEELK